MNDVDSNPINMKKQAEVDMRANEVDQLNVNHQSNMTLSANSVITQSHLSIKTNDNKIFEDGDENEPK
ncbi:hypothetical protein [Ruminiclostridium papyrosolvens]|uniref:Uncharacterized protein n=1 Tax=Ruminiclostridium papyrosolvens C7 TaxID=1330534 RepID=U4R130_9FIRM|nr:hypothetical protein [Ruminiclostridium papyrosolvens]EPR10478.1 hypothetical protein L323_12590 [Ruminiclostridium papyrosolvens C7]